MDDKITFDFLQPAPPPSFEPAGWVAACEKFEGEHPEALRVQGFGENSQPGPPEMPAEAWRLWRWLRYQEAPPEAFAAYEAEAVRCRLDPEIWGHLLKLAKATRWEHIRRPDRYLIAHPYMPFLLK